MDVILRLPNGTRLRERRRFATLSKTQARHWGQAREQHLFQKGPDRKKQVPTLAEFAPRYVEQHARANKLKPSSIAGIGSVLKHHLLPTLGALKLDAITGAQVQRLRLTLTNRSAKTTNNITGHLGSMLKRAVEWGDLDRLPCTIKPLKVVRREMRFYDFPAFERVVEAAKSRGAAAYVAVLLGGEAGLRLGEIVALRWSDIDLHARRLTVQRADWLGEVGSTKGGRLRHLPLTQRLTDALRAQRHLRSERVLCFDDGSAITRDSVIKMIRSVERRAGVIELGVHALRHTFCSHLAMRGAPARAIQELAGHASIQTTQKYMHLSPSATEDAIRLLDAAPLTWHTGGTVEAASGN